MLSHELVFNCCANKDSFCNSSHICRIADIDIMSFHGYMYHMINFLHDIGLVIVFVHINNCNRHSYH